MAPNGPERGGAEREFETHLSKFETYLVLRDYETEKTTGAPAPAAPASLAPMNIIDTDVYFAKIILDFSLVLPKLPNQKHNRIA